MRRYLTISIISILVIFLFTSCINTNNIKPNTTNDKASQVDTYDKYRATVPNEIKTRLKTVKFMFSASWGKNFENVRKSKNLEKPVYITIDIPNFLSTSNTEFETTEFVYDDLETGLYNQIDINGIYSVDDSFVLDEYSLGLLGYNEWTILEDSNIKYAPTYFGGIISKTKRGYNYLYQVTNISSNESMHSTSFIIDVLVQISPTSVIKLIISMDIRYLDMIPYIIQSIEYKGEI